MSLWNPRKPLNQPPNYRKLGAQDPHLRPSAEQRDAERAITEAQFQRDHAAVRYGGRRAVVVE